MIKIDTHLLSIEMVIVGIMSITYFSLCSGGFPNVDPFFTFIANEKVDTYQASKISCECYVLSVLTCLISF